MKPAVKSDRCLDCGAGIGRITKNLLVNHFNTVDLLEQDEKFCEVARQSLANSSQIGRIINIGLQDFNETEPQWDCVWIQWVLLYLPDKDLIDFFKRISNCLRKNGVIIVKENFTKGDVLSSIFDKEDSSVTRTLSVFKNIVKSSNLRIVKEMKQSNFPKELFPVYIFCLRPI